MTSEIKKFLSKKNIVIGLHASSREDAIHQLARVMEKNGTVSDAVTFEADVLQRESMTTTGIGNNIAIPHGKSEAVNTASLVFAKTDKGLEWNSLDGSKVGLIFLMAVRPKDEGKEHLRMLAKLSAKLMDDDFVKKIKQENDPQALLRIFDED